MQEFELDGQILLTRQLKNAWVLSVITGNLPRPNPTIHHAIISQGKIRLIKKTNFSDVGGNIRFVFRNRRKKVVRRYLDEFGNLAHENKAAEMLQPNDNYYAVPYSFDKFSLNKAKKNPHLSSTESLVKLSLAIASKVLGKKVFLFTDIENQRVKILPLDYDFAVPSHDGATFLMYRMCRIPCPEKTKLLIIDNPLLD